MAILALETGALDFLAATRGSAKEISHLHLCFEMASYQQVGRVIQE